MSEPKPHPWPEDAWRKASQAILNGTWKTQPPTRWPILLTPDGPISSPSQLQALAETESAPEVIVTTLIDSEGQEVQRDVEICDLSWDGWQTVKEKAFVSMGIIEDRFAMFEGKKRAILVVEGLRDGVTLGDMGEEQG